MYYYHHHHHPGRDFHPHQQLRHVRKDVVVKRSKERNGGVVFGMSLKIEIMGSPFFLFVLQEHAPVFNPPGVPPCCLHNKACLSLSDLLAKGGSFGIVLTSTVTSTLTSSLSSIVVIVRLVLPIQLLHHLTVPSELVIPLREEDRS